MLSAIHTNLSNIKDTLLQNLRKNLDSLFETYFRNLESFKTDEVHLSNILQCTTPNDYIHTEINYLNRKFREEISKFILDLPNSRNSGSILTYNDLYEFNEIGPSLIKQSNANDIAVLRLKNTDSGSFKISSIDFIGFLQGLAVLPKLTKLSLDFKNVQLTSSQICGIVKTLNATNQTNICSLALDFSDNEIGLDDNSADMLLDFAEKQRCLHSFVFSFTKTNVAKKSIDKLCDFLALKGSSLHFLRLSLAHSPLTDSFPDLIPQIVKSVSANSGLLHLELFFGGNKSIDEVHLRGVFYYLQNSHRLEHLELDFSETNVHIEDVLSLLAESDSLVELRVLFLYLNGLEFCEKLAEHLTVLSERFVLLEHLHVEVLNQDWSDLQRRFLKEKLKTENRDGIYFMNVVLENQ